MPEAREKGPDEIFCRSCGEAIKKKAEICPECGVRNEAGESGASTPTHDPSQYETTVSGSWWYGVAGGTALWVLSLMLSNAIPGNAAVGFLLVLAWIGLPVAAYFDMQYIRANGRWNPNTALWMIVLAVWVVNIVGGVVYLYRRHEVLGEP